MANFRPAVAGIPGVAVLVCANQRAFRVLQSGCANQRAFRVLQSWSGLSNIDMGQDGLGGEPTKLRVHVFT